MQYSQFERHIAEIITYWSPAVDFDNGGVFYNMEPVRHSIEIPGRKAFLMHVRQLYNFSVGSEMGLPGAKKIAKHLYASVDKVFDRTGGLYPFVPEYNSGPHRRFGGLFTSYNQWYFITAAARYSKAFGDAKAFHRAFGHFKLVKEAFSTGDFPRLGIYRVKNMDNGSVSGKTGNDHLHHFEALVHLAEAAETVLKRPEYEAVKKELGEYVDEAEAMFESKLLDKDSFMTPDSMEEDLSFAKRGHVTTLGHPLEWFGFLFEAQRHMKRPSPVLERHGRRILDENLSLALSDTGCFRSVYEFDSKRVYPKTDFWSQVEGILGALYGHVYFGDEQYLLMAETMWEFYRRTMCDPVHGGIYEQVSEDGIPVSYTKGSVWKCDHHALRVCEKIIRYRLLDR